jgi:hypothetical protein
MLAQRSKIKKTCAIVIFNYTPAKLLIINFLRLIFLYLKI